MKLQTLLSFLSKYFFCKTHKWGFNKTHSFYSCKYDPFYLSNTLYVYQPSLQLLVNSPFAFFISVFKVKDEDHLSTPIDDSSEEFVNQQLEHGIARGYIHNVSPLRNNSTYFDFQVQTKYKTVRAVCFSPQKRKVLNSFSKTDTPVKLKKCRLETK